MHVYVDVHHVQIYREEKEPWLGGPLEGLGKNMRAVALAANAGAKKAGRKSGALENCGGSLQRIFATAIGGSRPFLKATQMYSQTFF